MGVLQRHKPPSKRRVSERGPSRPLACLHSGDDTQRGKVPIVVGGTGLYLRFLVAGKVAGPGPAPPEVVARVKAALAQVGGEASYGRGSRVAAMLGGERGRGGGGGDSCAGGVLPGHGPWTSPL